MCILWKEGVIFILFKSSLRKNIWIYLISFSLNIISTSLPHAILTILLLNKGINVSQILLVQAAYNLAIIIFEFPSGVIADNFSRKNLFIFSRVLMIVMFTIIIFFNSLYLMMSAWFIYGISEALASGTLESQIVNDLKNMNQKDHIEEFISKSNTIRLISMVFGSTIGSFMFYKIGQNIYLLSILLTLISIFIIMFFFINYQHMPERKVRIRIHIEESIKELKENKFLKKSMYLSFLSQIFFQTHFQLWQYLFLQKSISEYYFPYVYIIFQLISIIAYNNPLRINRNLTKYNRIKVFITSLLPIFLLSSNSLVFFIIYATFVFIFTFFQYVSSTLMAKNVSLEKISSVTSLSSFISRIASMSTLLLTSFLLQYVHVEYIVIVNFIVSFLLSNCVLFFYLTNDDSNNLLKK